MGQIQECLEQITGDKASVKEYDAKGKVSLFLAGSYTYYLVNILGVDFIAVQPLENYTILQIQKHLHTIEEKTGYRAVYIAEVITSYKRKKLITSLIPFISLEGQLFLPFLGMYLEEKRKKNEEKRFVKRFTPAMQFIYLMILYSHKASVTQEEICKASGLSAMTVSRALEAFVDIGLLTYKIVGKTGRKKIYRCEDKKRYFETGRDYLTNPVKRSFYIQEIPEGMKLYTSGLSAVSDKTMLGEPEHLIVAASPEQESELLKYKIPQEIGIEESYPEVQVMKYNVEALAKDGYVDVVTIIWSLIEKDDRIELAIDELMEEYDWYGE